MPKKVDHASRIRTIAGAAIGVIGREGIDGMRLRDVAREASITTGAVTHYFDSKDAVLEAALAEIVRRIVEGQHQAMDMAGDFVAAVSAFLPNTDDRRRDWNVWLAFWGRAVVNARLRDQHKAYYAEISANLVVILRRLQAEGLADPARDPAMMADAIMAAVDGLGIRASLEPDDWPPERQLETLRLMLAPISATPTPKPHKR
jgi:TetR/AcrR family transcriptional repressor of bet genes